MKPARVLRALRNGYRPYPLIQPINARSLHTIQERLLAFGALIVSVSFHPDCRLSDISRPKKAAFCFGPTHGRLSKNLPPKYTWFYLLNKPYLHQVSGTVLLSHLFLWIFCSITFWACPQLRMQNLDLLFNLYSPWQTDAPLPKSGSVQLLLKRAPTLSDPSSQTTSHSKSQVIGNKYSDT